MSYGQVNADVIGTSVAGSNLGAGNASIMKNRIINGAMVISQRNGTSSVAVTDSAYIVDRWETYVSQTGKLSAQQNAGSVTPPVGFVNYLGYTSLSAYSVGASEQFIAVQPIEGYNIADLGFGTANAKTVTLSFWVYSSITGTHSGSLRNGAGNRSYVYTFTVTSANTWQYVSVTIAGDTSGTWTTTNGYGMGVQFNLGSGSTASTTAGSWTAGNYAGATGAVSVVGTNGATFYITGVQLEVGSSATGFEYVNYQTSLANCQRYYYRVNATSSYTPYGNGWASTSSGGQMVVKHPVRMRVEPTSLDYSLLSCGVLGVNEALVTSATISAGSSNGTDASTVNVSSSASFTTGFLTMTAKNSTSSYIGFSSEL
jgi:hypothetical protein